MKSRQQEHEEWLETFSVENERLAAINDYIVDWDDADQQQAEIVSSHIQFDGELPATVVIIPVAAHSEAPNIVHALSQYAKQEGADPFAVHLHLNWPKDAPASAVSDSFDAVQQARDLFPHLDIRISYAQYDSPTIGNIRRAAWNGTLLTHYDQDTRDAIGINNDIDLMELSKQYIAHIQKYYAPFREGNTTAPYAPIAYTESKHFASPDHPNTSLAVFWSDYESRAHRAGFEAGIVIPIATYAERGGFDASSKTYETQKFLTHGKQADMIRGTRLETSMRRYLDRLHEYGFGGIWGEGSFNPDDEYRVKDSFKDISRDEMVARVTELASNFAQNYIFNLLHNRLSSQERGMLLSDNPEKYEAMKAKIVAEIAQTEKVTRHVLDRVIKIPHTGPFLSNHFFNEAYINYQLYEYRLTQKQLNARILQDGDSEEP